MRQLLRLTVAERIYFEDDHRNLRWYSPNRTSRNNRNISRIHRCTNCRIRWWSIRENIFQTIHQKEIYRKMFKKRTRCVFGETSLTTSRIFLGGSVFEISRRSSFLLNATSTFSVHHSMQFLILYEKVRWRYASEISLV